jgi:hypothetical protein
MAHVATFNATSEYAGQQVMYYRGQASRMGSPFEIIGSGEVDVSFILDRDRGGQLDWVGEEERTWVYSFGHQPITTPTSLIDAATPQPPDGAVADHGVPMPGSAAAESMYGTKETPVNPAAQQNALKIILAIVGVIVLCTCCSFSSAFFVPFMGV